MLGASWNARQLKLYRRYGVLDNPFPFAGQPTTTARLEDAVDDTLVDRFRRFEEGGHASQVVTIEGAPGAGKANLLDYYEGRFRDYYRGRSDYYVIRYQPAAFDSVLTTILRSFGQRHLEPHLRRRAAEASGRNRSACRRVGEPGLFAEQGACRTLPPLD